MYFSFLELLHKYNFVFSTFQIDTKSVRKQKGTDPNTFELHLSIQISPVSKGHLYFNSYTSTK